MLNTSLIFFFKEKDGIRVFHVTGVKTCALPIFAAGSDAVGEAAGWAGCPHAEGCAGGEDGDGDEECGGGRPRQVCAGAGGDLRGGHASSSSSGRANQTPSGQDHSPLLWPAAGSCPGSSSHWCHAPS